MQGKRARPLNSKRCRRALGAALTVAVLAGPSVDNGIASEPRPDGRTSHQGFVRVIDGDTFEISRRGRRLGVGIIGIDAPMGNTRCGREATDMLWGLTSGGVVLENDAAIRFDRRERRMFYVSTPDHGSLALKLVRAGLAKATGTGDESTVLLRAQKRARAAGRGCLWSSAKSSVTGESQDALRLGDADLQPASMASGFTRDVVASGFVNPTSFATLPDGRFLVAEQRGVIKVVNGAQVLSTPALDIRSRVNAYWDRGLLSVAADPNFASNGYIYVLYTYENDASRFDGPKTARLSRFTMTGDVASASSELVLLGTAVGSSCKNFPDGTNCLPSDSPSHTVGAIRFASDGAMLVTTGDGASFNLVDDDALRAQSLSSLGGKVLRVTTTGAGLPDNPFFTGDPNANRSRVWAYGVRNAYRFTPRPGSTALYLGDVGWGNWEEVNVVRRGDNLGWPCYEGSARQSGYEPKAVCQSLYAAGSGAVRRPLHEYSHNGASAAVTGGAFYTGSSYPAIYQNAYFFGDYAQNFMKFLKTDGSDNLTAAPSMFEDAAGGPVDIQAGPGGDLYYVSITQGALVRVRYSGGGPITCAAGQFTAEYFANRTLSGSPTTTRCDDTISYDWGAGGPNANVGTDNFSVRWTASKTFTAGTYSFMARADDGIRVFVDGTQVIDAWRDQAATEYTADISLIAGEHTVVVEYYENAWDALAQVAWTATGGGGGGPVTCGAQQFTADHFANKSLNGTPVATTCDDTITYDWGRGGPGTGVGTDNFSIRWRANKTFAAGTYRFSARADDGIRVYVDGALTIDAWKDQAASDYTAERSLSEGEHSIVVEYYENAWDALANVSWSPAGGGGGGGTCEPGRFTAEYFANKTLSGTPTASRCEDDVSHNWGLGGPDVGVGIDNFSARWRATRTFTPGTYTFRARADDGVRVYVDGVRVIDAWKDQAATDYVGSHTITAGEHEVIVEYYENAFDALVDVSWENTFPTEPGAPSITIDRPVASDLYSVGQQISLAATATDEEEGDISDRIEWRIEIDHCPGGVCHVHTLLTTSGASGSFIAPDHGADSNMRVIATVTDSEGKTVTSSVLLRPRLVDVQLSTSPGGLTVTWDGASATSPMLRKAVVGSRHTIFTPSPQGNKVFQSWSDGGPQQHDVTIGSTNVTYTAKFSKR